MKENHITPPGVMLYTGFYESLKTLPDEMVGKLLLALMEYSFLGVVPEFDGALACAWAFLKDYADYDAVRYQRSVERRRAAAEKRWQREKADSPEKKTPSNSTFPKGISTPTASAHDGADWMKKYIKSPETTKS